MLAGIALYNPASATTVSRTSITLFMGEDLLTRILLRVAKYMLNRRFVSSNILWIIVVS